MLCFTQLGYRDVAVTWWDKVERQGSTRLSNAVINLLLFFRDELQARLGGAFVIDEFQGVRSWFSTRAFLGVSQPKIFRRRGRRSLNFKRTLTVHLEPEIDKYLHLDPEFSIGTGGRVGSVAVGSAVRTNGHVNMLVNVLCVVPMHTLFA